MGGLKNFNKIHKGYVFISHSHKDIEKVRRIRNRLEDGGFEPLCFYLKCLNENSEIEELIKREIDAREWFLYADSENARISKWVQLEREYIDSNKKKKDISIDINDEKSCISAIDKILHNLRVCVVSNGADEVSARLQEELKRKDYLVFGSMDYKGQKNFFARMKKETVKAAKEGCVIALLNEVSAVSVYTYWQIRATVKKRGNLVPVIVGDVELSEKLNGLLKGKRIYHLPKDPTDGDIADMVDMIGDAITKI